MNGPVRAAARLNFALRLNDGAAAPRPRGVATCASGAPDAARVLLLGNGIATGWGVSSHQLALTGALSRALTRACGFGVDVDHVGDETMNLAAAPAWLGDRPLGGYDAVVVVVGMNDALRLTPVPDWTRRWTRLLDLLAERVRPEAPLAVAGIQPVRSVPPFDTAFGALAQRHADRLNAAARRLVEARGASWTAMPAPEPDPARPLGSPAVYAAWAEHLVPAVAPGLAAARAAAPSPAAPPVPDAFEQLPAPARALVETPNANPRLQALAAEARSRLHVDAAMVTLMTDTTQYLAASTTVQPAAVPRGLTYCDVTVGQDAPLVVPNAKRDARFADNPYLDLVHLPFYAGVPLHDADGAPIGTFCVFSALPKSRSHVDMDELGALAAEAEHELRRSLAGLDAAALEDAAR